MTVELYDLILGVAVQAVAVADSAVSSLCTLYAAGASGALGTGLLVVGGVAGGAAGAAAAAAAGGGSGAGSNFPPSPDPFTEGENRMGRSRFRDSSGNGYWPGISPIPGDGYVNWTEPRHANRGGDRTVQLPVSPITGRPIFPPQSPEPSERPTAATVAGGRG